MSISYLSPLLLITTDAMVLLVDGGTDALMLLVEGSTDSLMLLVEGVIEEAGKFFKDSAMFLKPDSRH